ncbi:MAG: DnaA regulatory inactivator Hda [Pseudomonadales bacterium]
MSSEGPRQLSLSVRLDDHATFANYFSVPGSSNEMARSALQNLESPEFVYLWGGAGTGRSHLLQALCREFSGSWLYLPLAELVQADPVNVLEGLDSLDMLVLDDLDSVVGQLDWAEQIFHLYNRLQQQGKVLVVSASCSPAEIQTSLADLQSRLSAMKVFRLQSLSDKQLQEALKLRAGFRGFELPQPVAEYLLRHFPRSIQHQIAFLDQLDVGSLEAKRKLSIPLVKELLIKKGINHE